MINFYIIPAKTILDQISLTISDFEEYLESRPNIFEQVDVFCDNIRSQDQLYKHFELFNRTNTIGSNTIIVCPIYLELFEYKGKMDKVSNLLEHYTLLYPDNKIVFSWNHDADFAKYNSLFVPYKNVYIINYNTSRKQQNDILVPFWTLNTKLYTEKKKHNYGMISNFTHPCRMDLYNSFKNDPYFIHTTSLQKEEYYRTVSSCVFNFCPRGAGLNSWRFFESFHLNTIPVLFSNNIDLPYDIDYNTISVRFKEEDAKDYKLVHDKLLSVNLQEMLNNINKIRERFTLKGVQEEIYKRLI